MQLVSIVMPAYNAEKTISKAIDSILNQTHHNFELLIVDDGSRDKTKEIVDAYASKDSRVRCFHISNNGVSNARNVGLNEAKGELISFVDSDDYVDKEFLEMMISMMQPNIDIACCGYEMVSADEKSIFKQIAPVGTWDKETMYLGIEALQNCKALNTVWNKLFRARIIRDNNLRMDTTTSMGEDLLFIIDYFHVMNGGMNSTDRCLYEYRQSPNGLQASFDNSQGLKRMERTRRLETYYLENNYPMMGIRRTQIRTFFTAVMEAEDPTETIKKIYGMPEYNLCVKNRYNEIKFDVFAYLLKHKRTYLVAILVKIYKKVKSRATI